MFPGTGDHPEYSLMRPAVAPIQNGASALVVGWYGPRCVPGMLTMPSYDLGASLRCSSGGGSRSFIVNGETGVTSMSTAHVRAFAAATVLDDNIVMVASGVANES